MLAPKTSSPRSVWLDVDVQAAGHDDRLEEHLHRLGDGRLQRVGDDRQADARHVGYQARPAGGAVDHHRSGDVATVGRHTRHPAGLDRDPEHLGLLVDLDAESIGCPGVAPVHRVMADDPARRMVEGAEDRVARVGRGVHEGHELFDLVRPDDLGVDALELVDLGPPAHRPKRAVVVGEGEVAPLGEHDVEVEVGGERLVEPDRAVVEADAFGGQVVGTDDGGVAARAAAADVALVEHGHLANAVIGGEIVGGGETVDSGADRPRRRRSARDRDRSPDSAASPAWSARGERALRPSTAAPASRARCRHALSTRRGGR